MPERSLGSAHDVPMDDEPPHLSTSPPSSNERAPSATPSDSSDRRPASLISTLSSGSGSSRDNAPGPAPPPSPLSSEPDPDASPPDGAAEGEGRSWLHPGPDRRGRGLDHKDTNKQNNNKAEATPTRAPQDPPLPRTGSMAPSPQLTYLDRVVLEIIETERTYVRDLRMIVEDYLAHIIDQCDVLIRPDQVCALFGNIEDIYEFNSELLQALDLCDNDPVAVARCFVMRSEYFDIYTQYCTNYPNSVAALTDCMRNKTLAKFFRERQATLKRSLPLGSYLLKPVQRILKYHLLLQEIAKHFDPEEGGYEVVEEAIYTMTGVAWYINDMKRKHEHAIRLQEVQSLLLNWKGPDLTTYGELVLEGTFRLHRAKSERTLFLFERMLLITKRRGEHYAYKTHISCATLMLIESAKDSLSFSVTHYKHPKQPHTVQAKTVEERKLWAHHIKRIILENHRNIIPQKAKDAIMEMNPTYPPRYRFSPERLKKALSSHSDVGRQGRRQSEPIKQVTKSSKDSLKEAKGGVASSNGCSKENGRLPVEDEPGGAETPGKQLKLPKETVPDSEPTENPEPESPSDPDSLSATPPRTSPRSSGQLTPRGDPEFPGKPSSAATDSDSKTLSSEESSEDEDGKDTAEKESQVTSILPSSVLDKASAIAQHFTNSIKRGSLPQDDKRPLSCGSPRLPSRSSSSLSMGVETADRPLRLSSVGSETETAGVADLTLLSPWEDSLFETNRGIRRRRDSTLSKQDQLLIGKIRSYYELAESQDANFSLQRRESLTYIPTGLVRSSVSRINSIPKGKTVKTDSTITATASSLDPFPTESNLPTEGLMFSSDSSECLKSDQRSTLPEDSRESQWSGSQNVQDNPSDEEFRPSSEMIKIWQMMEQDITGSQSEDKDQESQRNTQNKSAEVNTTMEVSSGSPSLMQEFSNANQTECQTDSPKAPWEDTILVKAPLPRVAQLKAEAADEKPRGDPKRLDEVDKSQSKVFNLARQYSQRIKTVKPMVRQRSQGLLFNKTTLPCVVEEKESSGKTNPTQPLPSQDSVDPIRSLTSGLASSTERTVSRSHSPPLSSSREGFNWPDVRELRSKYSSQSLSHKTPVSRTTSVPDQMFDSGLRRNSATSKPQSSWDDNREERKKRLQRSKSLEPRLSRAQKTDLQNLQEKVANSNTDGYYIAAEVPLPTDPEHKMVIVEKIHKAQSSETAKEPKEEEENYVQIRSPTSKEKISIMAVIDRCRAYQESDEYKQREDVKAKTELDSTTVTSNQQDSAGQKTEAGPQGIVKNLREKFQSLS
ncbi:pleckstrin homology domain-containing family G member 3-like isoform X2 [Antennarius striatus]|uniref:pleckstrin homology domain-containing family G member 3-like isoform X2 n=1 Tax=Antennarius striatus TaxID=241820 RepID=UPI0035AED1AC